MIWTTASARRTRWIPAGGRAVGIMLLMASCGPGTRHGRGQDPMTAWQAEPPRWATCEPGTPAATLGAECAALTVPLDWSRPLGPSISLPIVRLRAPEPPGTTVGTVVLLSGGPGGSSIDDLPVVAELLPDVRARFDLVAHEPRTALALRTVPAPCHRPPGVVLDIPGDSAAYARMLAPLTAAVDECRSMVQNGLVDHLDGRSQALDVEAIRRALGAPRIDLVAQSYGGVVVAAYARLFPQRVRSAFVDGVASHPDFPQAAGSGTRHREFQRFADWCAEDPRCALHGEDVVEVWGALTRAANLEPVPGSSERFGPQHLSGAQMHFLTRGWRSPGPSNEGWVRLSGDIDRARQGDATPFVDWAVGNLMVWSAPISMALQCPDGAEGVPGYRSFLRRWDGYRRDDPLFYGTKLLGMACEAWPVPLANPPAPLPVRRLPPFLGAGTLANDFQGTAQFLDHVPGSVVVGVPGSGHVVYLGGAGPTAQACVAGFLSRYLIDLSRPPPGTRCARE